MLLIKHKDRGYGHAEKTTQNDGRVGYSVRFFDRYDYQLHFTEQSISRGILEILEEGEKTVRN